MANVTRKQIINALTDSDIVELIAARLGTDSTDVEDTIDKMVEATNRKRVSKPSAETLRNRQLAKELAEEIVARGGEFTAAEIAEFYTDPDGLTLSTRKVGALLKNAAAMGFIEVSPEPWPVKHYGPVGFDFAKKPERKRKAKKEDATPEE